ncbi:MAG TPA: alpha/beta fold hydrolase [Polyangiaceae bacterium]|nr:alpha/beta fold hydrolase [Polyangiaceae bacterium]
MLHEPVAPKRRAGVVLCNPFGYEAICAHRSYRHLAERLARAGHATLRFDYDGTGDSFGDDTDPERMRAWIDSIHAAVSELRERSGVHEVVLFGMRLGGLLAVHAACERGDVSGLVLWAPCTSGKAYLRELKVLQRIHAETLDTAPASRTGEIDEALGFAISADTAQALNALDLRQLSACSARDALLIAREEFSGDLRAAPQLTRLGLNTSTESLPRFAAMMTDPHKSELPEHAFSCIEHWLAQRSEGSASLSPDGAKSAPQPFSRPRASPVRERCLRIGKQNAFGILCEPAAPAASASAQGPRTAAIFLNAGAIHRIGMNRMYVSLARRWAELGVPSLRLDISSIGDSAAEENGAENRIYSKHAVSDVKAALDELVRSGVAERFVLVGLCSGAYAAFHSALADTRVAGTMLINPQTFEYKEGDSLEVQRRRNFREVRYYQRSFFRAASWAKALRGDVNFAYIAQVLGTRLRAVARARWEGLRHWLGERNVPNPTFEAVKGLCGRGCSVFCIYSGDDPGLEHFHESLGGHERTLLARPEFSLEVIAGPDHTFTPLWSQARLSEVLERCLVACQRGTGARSLGPLANTHART